MSRVESHKSSGPAAIKVFDDPLSLAIGFGADFASWIPESAGQVNVALSGGSTPQLLFQYWASSDCPPVDWHRVHFFWGDERCVPAESPDSNFGVANRLFFRPAGIPTENIHPIRGELDPESEVLRYAAEIREHVAIRNGLPQFDIQLLGMGADGHTASIFPDQMHLLDVAEVCAVARHPETAQTRITLSGPVITNSARIVFLISGESKSAKTSAILGHAANASAWPATRFFSLSTTSIYLDRAARGS